MAKFTAKVLFLICTLLFGILLGIYQAETGILTIKGVAKDSAQVQQEEDESLPEKESADEADEELAEESEEDVYITRIDGNEVEMAVVGQAIDLEEKQEKWEQRNYHNKYSHVGNKIGGLVYSVSEKGAAWFVQQLDKVL